MQVLISSFKSIRTNRRTTAWGFVVAFFCLASSGFAATPRLDLPPRLAGAPTGSEFYQLIKTLSQNDREQLVINEIARGNIPDFLRDLKPVPVSGLVSGQTVSTVIYVTPDYMAIGSDTDFFRMPMDAPLAQQVADYLHCSLTTRKTVNDIYTAATIKLAPYPFSPANYTINSVDVFWLSNQAIEGQRSGKPLGQLVGGIKKDVVITPQIPTRPSPARVAIYGWHQLNGQPIQPLSLVHESTYMDYSHGIRLIWNQIDVGGTVYTMPQLLAHPTLNVLVSDEGASGVSAYPIPNPFPITLSDSLIINGSFEQTFTGTVAPSWQSWTGPGSAAVTFGRASVNHFDGAASQYFARNDTAAMDVAIQQTVPTIPGATYQLSVQMKRQSTFAGTIFGAGYDPTGGTDPAASSVVYTSLVDAAADGTWVPYSHDFTALSTATTVFFRGGHTETTGGANAYFYIDAASMYLLSLPGGATDLWMMY